MTALAVAIGFAAGALALWDGVRRALNAQVRQAELRVEALRRTDYEAAVKAHSELAAKVTKIAGDLSSLETGLATGRRR